MCESISEAEFETMGEPARAAREVVLAFAKIAIDKKRDPSIAMSMQRQNIDRVAAMMCGLQLALWNVPAVVTVGSTLACRF